MQVGQVDLISVATPQILDEIEVEVSGASKRAVQQIAQNLTQTIHDDLKVGFAALQGNGSEFYKVVKATYLKPEQEAEVAQAPEKLRALLDKVVNRAKILLYLPPGNPTSKVFGSIDAVQGDNIAHRFIQVQAFSHAQTLMQQLQQSYTQEVIDQIPAASLIK